MIQKVYFLLIHKLPYHILSYVRSLFMISLLLYIYQSKAFPAPWTFQRNFYVSPFSYEQIRINRQQCWHWLKESSKKVQACSCPAFLIFFDFSHCPSFNFEWWVCLFFVFFKKKHFNRCFNLKNVRDETTAVACSSAWQRKDTNVSL